MEHFSCRKSLPLAKLFAAILALALAFGCQSTEGESESENPEIGAELQADNPPQPFVSTKSDHGLATCITRPDPEECCESEAEECAICREKAEEALTIWRRDCLPQFAELQNCSAGVKISTCCGDETPECRDCRIKALDTMIQWRSRCGPGELKNDCSTEPKAPSCCTSALVACDLCRERAVKVVAAWQLRCSVQARAGQSGSDSDAPEKAVD